MGINEKPLTCISGLSYNVELCMPQTSYLECTLARQRATTNLTYHPTFCH